MANPLVRLGVKALVKGGKKLAKKINTKRVSANSTDNMTRGPIDKAINKVNMRAGKRMKPTREDMIPDINPNEYGYGTGGMYQSPPKSSVRDRMKAKKTNWEDDFDDIPF